MGCFAISGYFVTLAESILLIQQQKILNLTCKCCKLSSCKFAEILKTLKKSNEESPTEI